MHSTGTLLVVFAIGWYFICICSPFKHIGFCRSAYIYIIEIYIIMQHFINKGTLFHILYFVLVILDDVNYVWLFIKLYNLIHSSVVMRF